MKDDRESPVRVGGSIQTFSGKIIYPLDPREEDIFLEDVAHSMGAKARFTGHTSKFYSSGEHAVRVSWVLRDIFNASLMDQFVGLHHDDSDAYLPDVPTPLKILPEFEWFRNLERQHQELCFKKFGCVVTDYALIKKADVMLLLTEKRDLMRKTNSASDKKYLDKYGVAEIPFPYQIKPWSPLRAKKEYLKRNRELVNAIIQDNPAQGNLLLKGNTIESRKKILASLGVARTRQNKI